MSTSFMPMVFMISFGASPGAWVGRVAATGSVGAGFTSAIGGGGGFGVTSGTASFGGLTGGATSPTELFGSTGSGRTATIPPSLSLPGKPPDTQPTVKPTIKPRSNTPATSAGRAHAAKPSGLCRPTGNDCADVD